MLNLTEKKKRLKFSLMVLLNTIKNIFWARTKLWEFLKIRKPFLSGNENLLLKNCRRL